MGISVFRQNRWIALLVGALLVSLSLISLLGMQTITEKGGKKESAEARQAASSSTVPVTHGDINVQSKNKIDIKSNIEKKEGNPVQLPGLFAANELQGWKPEPDTLLSLPEIERQEENVPSKKQEKSTPEKKSTPSKKDDDNRISKSSSNDAASSTTAKQVKPKKKEGTTAVQPKAKSLQPPTKLFFTRTKTLTQDQKENATWDYALSAEELLLLQKIVMAEAEGEPYEGKVAVANVVLNRLRSANFPDTIRNVIYQKYQFSPVANGRMDRVKPSKETIKAVTAALHGHKAVSDDTYFFLSLTLAQDLTVHHSRTFSKKIGNHSFYK
ncbi:cell wall hydrolase [Paenibacillus lemnae]|uniref:Cell wall hydrolase n=1 Tax=Paenibacillus lemnae TaxID=1330551 RepID=A0A848M610_PAELE|nr:cell wall hydrolase [Paenibacillus lemnae]NMO95689.1 cell wall hydrolase [Paenibacillus lemnae]